MALYEITLVSIQLGISSRFPCTFPITFEGIVAQENFGGGRVKLV